MTNFKFDFKMNIGGVLKVKAESESEAKKFINEVLDKILDSLNDNGIESECYKSSKLERKKK